MANKNHTRSIFIKFTLSVFIFSFPFSSDPLANHFPSRGGVLFRLLDFD
jgi:hypothetical protein